MKSFFEEYGFILVSVIVIVALIGIINGDDGVADTIGTSTNSIVEKFSSNAEGQVDALIGD